MKETVDARQGVGEQALSPAVREALGMPLPVVVRCRCHRKQRARDAGADAGPFLGQWPGRHCGIVLGQVVIGLFRTLSCLSTVAAGPAGRCRRARLVSSGALSQHTKLDTDSSEARLRCPR